MFDSVRATRYLTWKRSKFLRIGSAESGPPSNFPGNVTRMLRRAASPSARGAGGGFSWLGRIVVRHPVMVIVAWLAIAVVMVLSLPSLATVGEKNPPPFLPKDAPVVVSGQAMTEAFRETGSANMVVAALVNEKGLGPADEAIYRTLADKLRADTVDVLAVQDFIHTPEIRQVVTSKDNKAWNLPVNLVGEIGTPEGQQAYRNVDQIVKEVTANTSLTAHVIGGASTLDDLTKIGTRDQHLIEIATVLMVLTILIMVYRNVVAMLLPVATIGVSLVVAQQAVAGLGELGLGVAPQTVVLMSAMMLGAGTDYGIFLMSRYHEFMRSGLGSDDALVSALTSIGKVIAGSAGTVAVAFMGMAFTKLGAFSTVGPALAVTVFFGFLASTTLLPALIVLTGRRGWVKPRRELTGRFWRRSGVHIVRRPRSHLAASLVILIALAGCATLAKFNYDDRKSLPADADSKIAYCCRAEALPGRPHGAANHPHPVSRRLALPEGARRSRADGTSGESIARCRPGARYHQTNRRSPPGGEDHLPGRRSGVATPRGFQPDSGQRREPLPFERRSTPACRRAGTDSRQCVRSGRHYPPPRQRTG